MIEPVLDSTASAQLVVGPADLASALPIEQQDAFPAVFATARMVALMEIASARLLYPSLGDGELSVGVSLDVAHTAPTPVGATVTATARYLGREGKLFLFEVIASDAGGEIGRGGTNERSSQRSAFKAEPPNALQLLPSKVSRSAAHPSDERFFHVWQVWPLQNDWLEDAVFVERPAMRKENLRTGPASDCVRTCGYFASGRGAYRVPDRTSRILISRAAGVKGFWR